MFPQKTAIFFYRNGRIISEQLKIRGNFFNRGLVSSFHGFGRSIFRKIRPYTWNR